MKSPTVSEFMEHLLEQVSIISPGVRRYLGVLLKLGVSKCEERPDLSPRRSKIPIPAKKDSEIHRRVSRGRISKNWKRRTNKSSSPKGLSNTGGYLCYRNSMTQCLLHLPEFADYLDYIHSPWQCLEPFDRCVICALKALMDEYHCEEKNANPKGLQNALNRFNRALKTTVPQGHDMEQDFKRDLQSDPYDFLKYLFERFNEVELAGDEFKFADLFTVEHKTQWTCADCGQVSSRAEASAESGHGIGLSVNIRLPQTGLSMLRYLRENEYQEELQLRCESADCVAKFGEKAEGSSRLRIKLITSAPEILVIRLVRFRQVWDKRGQLRDIKIPEKVSFEEYLNLGEFTESQEPLFYKLMGVVCHQGRNITSGHYIAAVREDDGNKFSSINDDRRIAKERGGTVEELELPQSYNKSFDPYVLVYSKVPNTDASSEIHTRSDFEED